MGQSFNFIDLIFLALVTGFLVLRLRSVLGRRTGNEKRPQDKERRDNDNVITLPTRDQDDEQAETAAPPRRSSRWGEIVGKIDSTAEAGVERIRAADASFDPQVFLDGARTAFEMILDAYAKGDAKTLRDLLDDSVYTPFAQMISEREARGETMTSELIAFKSVTLVDADLIDNSAQVTVRFVTEMMIMVRDSQDRVVDGDPTKIDQVDDLWTFRRDVTSKSPNWYLTKTSSPDA